MIKMFARHTVDDFEKWKEAYDNFNAMQKDMGVVSESVFRGAENPNDLTITHDFETLEDATAFTSSDALRNAMEEAGVTGPPDIWFTSPI